MPDRWEARHALDAAEPADGPADSDGDGYTNLEEYLNSTHPKAYESWIVSRKSWLPQFPLARRYERDRDARSRTEK